MLISNSDVGAENIANGRIYLKPISNVGAENIDDSRRS
jgi:hypothetical protein